MEEIKQHVQVPNMNLKEQGLINTDPYIYACIKKYMNQNTKEAFPKLATLVKDSGLHKDTVMSSIKRLEAAGYIQIKRKIGKSNVYVFNDYTKFEIFSYDFLDEANLTPKEKSYLVTAQQYMYKTPEINQGNISFTNEELADRLGVNLKTLRKYEKSLENKNILTMVPIKTIDRVTGLNNCQRIYNFNEFANTVALKFLDQDKTLEDHNQRITKLENTVNQLVKTNELLMRENKILKEEKNSLNEIIL